MATAVITDYFNAVSIVGSIFFNACERHSGFKLSTRSFRKVCGNILSTKFINFELYLKENPIIYNGISIHVSLLEHVQHGCVYIEKLCRYIFKGPFYLK